MDVKAIEKITRVGLNVTLSFAEASVLAAYLTRVPRHDIHVPYVAEQLEEKLHAYLGREEGKHGTSGSNGPGSSA